MEPIDMSTPKVKLPKSCRWAVEDSIALSLKGYTIAMDIHRFSNDPNIMHKMMDIIEIFLQIERSIKQIGIEDEQ